MISNPLVLKHTLFDEIHVEQEGAILQGFGRFVIFDSCLFNQITTDTGGSCIDLESSTLYVLESCFRRCKN